MRDQVELPLPAAPRFAVTSALQHLDFVLDVRPRSHDGDLASLPTHPGLARLDELLVLGLGPALWMQEKTHRPEALETLVPRHVGGIEVRDRGTIDFGQHPRGNLAGRSRRPAEAEQLWIARVIGGPRWLQVSDFHGIGDGRRP